MSDTDLSTYDRKTASDRTVMHVLYGLHTTAPFTMWTLSVVAVIVNYVKRSDEADPLYAQHHAYMISTFWWALLWLLLTSPLFLLFLLPGIVAWVLVGAWYLYRYLRGWLRFNDHRMP
jgi:uncharacterized membrane protein